MIALAKRKHPRVVKEFREVLPSLDKSEFRLLEEDILKRGILHPIFVWNGICIDGMNRLQIAKKNNLKYDITELEFDDKWSAKEWIYKHQAGKRNQTKFSKIASGLKFEDYYKKQSKENQRKSPGRGKKGCIKIIQKVDTLQKIAEVAGVARSYVSNTKYILENAKPETIAKCHRGELSIRNAYLKAQDQARSKRRLTALDKLEKYKNPDGWINNIHCGDNLQLMRKMRKELKGQISSVIFSPNYNNNTNYFNKHNDSIPYKKYLDYLGKVFLESYILLRPGGRIVCQVDSMTNTLEVDKGDAYKHTIYPDLVCKVRELNKKHNINLRFFTEICWYKFNGAGKKSAHGSYASCSCPTTKRTHEYILVWSKDQWQLPCREGIPSDITAKEFNKYIWSLWEVHPITARNAPHPCTYPPQLMERLIKLFSYPGDIILDPFNGSGTTTAVAKELGRRYIGLEQNPSYCSYAKKRVGEVLKK
jgi:DNA modification methylase